MKKIEKTIDLAGRKLTLTTGGIAEQASGAVMARYGDTVVLSTVVAAPMKQDLGYFPLSVEYQERLYAGGKIKGSRWIKREGRPSDEEVLAGRVIDRSIRPLFPKEYKADVQVIVTVLSVDLENDPEILAAVATSAALAISPIPWKGPVGVVRVGLNKDFILNPKDEEMDSSLMNLIVTTTKDAILMIEDGSKEITEKQMIDAISFGQKEAQKVIDLIEDLAKAVKVEKVTLLEKKHSATLEKKVEALVKDKVDYLIKAMATKESSYEAYDEVKKATLDSFEDEEKGDVANIFEDIFKREVRKFILSGKRADGRKVDEIRPLSSIVGVLPRTHGSAIFQRGQTQVLSIATLGAPSLGQLIESASGEETKRYIHHYSFPPYSVGETGRVGSPSRREIGHGALAEKALLPVIPGEEEFPYTIRVVSEVLSSNGSTSMGSTCGSTLSLMDAGVPIKKPVAGIAMGLIVESEEKFLVLTDIVGIEDGNGDMDFKVAGTKDGITALQLDVKTLKLTVKILEKALEQAKEARMKILEVMSKAINAPRAEVSVYAPKIRTTKIDKEKIGELIGPGGKNIKGISAETGAQVDVDEEGKVVVTAMDIASVDAAIKRVDSITKIFQPGEIYDGIVRRIQPFGAFVEVLPGRDGLVHISDMSQEFVKDPNDIVKIGDTVKVRVKEVDDMGRLNLSMLLEGDRKRERPQESKDQTWSTAARGPRKFDRRPPQRGGQEQRRFGPHFPTSRFIQGDNNKKKFQ